MLKPLAVAALVALCLIGGAAQAQASTKIVNQGNGLALGIMNNGPAANGAYLALQPYDGRATQQWSLTALSYAGFYWLKNVANPSLCASFDGGPLRLGPCTSAPYSLAWMYLRAEPAGGYSIRPLYDQWPFGDLYANAYITDDGPRPPSAWYRWNLVAVTSPSPPPEHDPLPPVCVNKPSLC